MAEVTSPERAARQARLATALRANLRRRKAATPRPQASPREVAPAPPETDR